MSSSKMIVTGVQPADGSLLLQCHFEKNKKDSYTDGIVAQKYGTPAESFTKSALLEIYLEIKDEKIASSKECLQEAKELFKTIHPNLNPAQYSNVDLLILHKLWSQSIESIIETLRGRLNTLGKLTILDHDVHYDPFIDHLEKE